MSTAHSPAISVSKPVSRGAAESRFYRPELDVLRFFAAFGVYVFHSFPKESSFWISRGFPNAVAIGLSALIGSGRFGVDLFFALSSFLITELLLREREQCGFVNVKAFYIRRILRIWPLYFFFIALACGITLWDKTQHVGWNYVLAYILLAGNWMIAFHGAPMSVIVPLWSVSVEEQFYLLWPLAVRKATMRGILLISGLMLVVSNLTRYFLVRSGHGGDSIWCNSFARIDAIALGILFALAARKFKPSLHIPSRLVCFLCGSALWLFAAHYGRVGEKIPSMSGTLLAYPAAALGSLLFLLAAYRGPERGIGILKNAHLIYLGQISYGIYVYHELGLLLSHHALGSYTKSALGYAAYWVLALALTIAFAMISYPIIEKPFLNLKRRFTFVLSRPV